MNPSSWKKCTFSCGFSRKSALLFFGTAFWLPVYHFNASFSASLLEMSLITPSLTLPSSPSMRLLACSSSSETFPKLLPHDSERDLEKGALNDGESDIINVIDENPQSKCPLPFGSGLASCAAELPEGPHAVVLTRPGRRK